MAATMNCLAAWDVKLVGIAAEGAAIPQKPENPVSFRHYRACRLEMLLNRCKSRRGRYSPAVLALTEGF